MSEPSVLVTQQAFSHDLHSVANRIDPMLLQNTALRYAAGDLNEEETVAFEERLANDQDARDALSEAVRLSAAALGQAPPAPHASFRLAIHERLLGWCPNWLARRAYRGHPLAWAVVGAAVVAAFTVFALSLTDREESSLGTPAGTYPTSSIIPYDHTAVAAPEPRTVVPESIAAVSIPRECVAVTHSPQSCGAEATCNHTVAEIWAELSTPDHVEKAHEEELRWRHKLRDIGAMHPSRPAPTSSIADGREP
jgi:hypothetical protein